MTIDELKKLCAAATPGPWESRMNPWTYRGTVGAKGRGVVAETSTFEDGDLIAAAVTMLPKLLAVAEAAKTYIFEGGENCYCGPEECSPCCQLRDEVRDLIIDLEIP